jgi:uridine kinase
MPTCNAFDSDVFSGTLYEKMKRIDPAVQELELYEFRYGLDSLCPREGQWDAVKVQAMLEIEEQTNRSDFYKRIQAKPRANGRIVLDENIVRLTTMLFAGLVTNVYSEEWVRTHFYFDVRGFIFLHRTDYYPASVLAHLGGKPYAAFEPKQKRLEWRQDIGYKEFKQANVEVDQVFIGGVQKLIASKGTPVLLAIAGPTAAGKTEIVERLRALLEILGKQVTSIELDNFFLDRDYREARGIDSLGKQAYHFELFRRGLEDIVHGNRIVIPRYDTVFATSSHDLDSRLRPGGVPITIEPADIIFIEGNFPFLLEEVAPLVGIKVVYLTDDPVRLKRKWRRDIDYRKKYDPAYLCNRFFKDQFLMAEKCYIPQMQVCDLVVDTTHAALWASPSAASVLDQDD